MTEPDTAQIPQPINGSLGSTPQAHGHVYALSLDGKPQWPTPAFVSQQFLLRDQPAESPLLFFLRSSRGRSDARWASQALVLDKRTGGIVMEGDVNQAQTISAEVNIEPARAEAALKMWFSPGSKTMTFKLTDEPAPPQPPAQLGSQASSSVGERRGTVANIAGAIINAFSSRSRFASPEDEQRAKQIEAAKQRALERRVAPRP
jgi:hypothetical protein